MISDDAKIILNNLNDLLNMVQLPETLPPEISGDVSFLQVEETIKTLRIVVEELANGDLSYHIRGKGFMLGSLKKLQASLRSLTWTTKAVASGDFSQRVDFLGEFSEAFNSMVTKLESAILQIEEARTHFEMIFQTIPDATVMTKVEDGRLIAYNQAFMETTKFTDDDLSNDSFTLANLLIDFEQWDRFIKGLEINDHIENMEIRFHDKDNQAHIGLISSKTIMLEDIPHILSVIRDITELKVIEAKLQQSEERHRFLADNAADVIWMMDLQGRFTYVSPSVEKLRGYTVAEVMSQTPEEALCQDSLIHFDEGLKRAIHGIENKLPFRDFRGELEQPCKDGTSVWTEATVSAIYNENNDFIGLLGVTRDISERKIMEEEIRRLSVTDKLTQSFNRLKLDETLEEAFKGLKERSFSILILDIDYFKRVNDTYGHQVGDRVLIELVAVLKEKVRENDVIGRWGGEEFLVILPNTALREAEALANRLCSGIEKTDFTKVGHVTISIGVSACRNDDLSSGNIVSRADTALYQAKKNGRNRVEVIA